MKRLIIYILFQIACINVNGQVPFRLEFDLNNNNLFLDACKIDDRYYVLHIQYSIVEDKFTTAILVVNHKGEITDSFPIGHEKEYFLSYLGNTEETIELLSTEPLGNCPSTIKISRISLKTRQVEVLSSTLLCEGAIQSLNTVQGLNGEVFLDEVHYNNGVYRKNIWKIDSDYKLTKVFIDLAWSKRLSVDFSGKGYVLASIGLYDFYDKNFNFRKQRYSEDHHLMFNWRNTPFREGLLMEYTSDVAGSLEGIQLRLIDSNLFKKHIVEVLPPTGYNTGEAYCASNTGYAITPDKEIWFTGYYNVTLPFLQLSTPYMVTKVDSSLNIICQHFIIDENAYLVFGLRHFLTGEIAIFGKGRNRFEMVNSEEDAFLIVFGENCESPFTTSTEDSKDIISISAYPNPTVNDLTIRVSGMDESLLRIEFFDRSGKTIDVHTNLTSSIQVHDYLPGQYFYRIMDQDDRILGVGSWLKQ